MKEKAAKIIDTLAEAIIKPVGPPLLIRLCSMEFLDSESPSSQLACTAMDEHDQDFLFISSHRDFEENPSRFIFRIASETKSGSRFQMMIFRALREKRGFLLDGRWITSDDVKDWLRPDNGKQHEPNIVLCPTTGRLSSHGGGEGQAK